MLVSLQGSDDDGDPIAFTAVVQAASPAGVASSITLLQAVSPPNHENDKTTLNLSVVAQNRLNVSSSPGTTFGFSYSLQEVANAVAGSPLLYAMQGATQTQLSRTKSELSIEYFSVHMASV